MNFEEVLEVLTEHFGNQFVATRMEALKWVVVLHETAEKSEKEGGEGGGEGGREVCLQKLLPSLLKNLSDPSDDVVRLNLQVERYLGVVKSWLMWMCVIHSNLILFLFPKGFGIDFPRRREVSTFDEYLGGCV